MCVCGNPFRLPFAGFFLTAGSWGRGQTDILVAIFFALLAFLSFSNNIRGIIGMWELAAGHWRHVHSTMHVCFLAIVLAGPTRGWWVPRSPRVSVSLCA